MNKDRVIKAMNAKVEHLENGQSEFHLDSEVIEVSPGQYEVGDLTTVVLKFTTDKPELILKTKKFYVNELMHQLTEGVE